MPRLSFLCCFILVFNLFACSNHDTDANLTKVSDEVAPKAIFGGVEVESTDPISLSSIALLEGDGEQVCSGTLITANVIVSAAHCFTTFSPYYVSFGGEVPQKTFWTDDLSDRRKFPNVREIASFAVHPDYDSSVTGDNAEELRPPNDIAFAIIADGAPSGFVPARVIAPGSALTTDITIAGFGAFPEYDPMDPAPPRLRKVDTFIGAILSQSKLLKDGPNPGKGSCVRDSGGSIYLRTNLTETPIVIGNVVSGPLDCSEGLGYNTDLRHYVPWLESATGQTLTKVAISSNCGNGAVDAGEACDGGSVSCGDINDGYISGAAACNAQCSGYDESSCVAEPIQNRCVESACGAEGLPRGIPDNSSAGTTSTIPIAGLAGTVSGVDVTVEIVHTYRGDLRVRLVSPTGREALLFDRTGAGADNLSLELSLADFDGLDPAGDWSLIVSDHAGQDTGTLVSWSLRLTEDLPAICGDGIVEGSEVCDGGAMSCVAIDGARFSGGVAPCDSACGGYDVSPCAVIENLSSCVAAACVSSDADLPIPDNSAAGISSIVRVETFTGALHSVHLVLSIDHTYRGDLYVTLTSPQGTVKVLHNKSGGSADDLNLDVTLADFAGEAPTGDFVLFVSDRASRDVGTLEGWSIQLD